MRRLSAAIAGSLVILSLPVAAFAQAYLGDPNSLSSSFEYTYAPSGKIIATTGDDGDAFDNSVPGVPEQVHIFNIGLQYMTPVEGLAAEVSIPLVGLKLGDTHFIHYPQVGEYDDGDMHFSFTDLRGGLRYQVKAIQEYVGLSFLVAGSVPVTDYPVNGFLFPDHHLKTLYLGGSLARTLDPAIPDMFFSVDYTFALRERVDETENTERFNRNYSDAGVLLGYFLPAGFNIAAGANIRRTHGGVTLGDLIVQPMDVQVHHDRLLDEDFAHVGGNLGYSVSDALDVGAAVRFFVWGQNTRNQNLFGLYANYTIF
jgi:hypothetical protein